MTHENSKTDLIKDRIPGDIYSLLVFNSKSLCRCFRSNKNDVKNGELAVENSSIYKIHGETVLSDS